VRYLGLYGLQEIHDGQVQVDPRLEAARPAVVAAHQALKAHPVVQASGAWLEDKEYAVAVHTRRVADPDRWAAPIDQAAREVADRHGLEVVPGKLVWELRPDVRSDKGDAVRRVVAESAAREVVVVGDDLGDLAAFAAVAGLTAEGGEGLRVAVRSAEAPPQLLAEADLVVEGPPGVLDFLHRLAA
jgi:trehalose 6-phosphate phosphatase